MPAHIWTPWFAALGAQSGFDFDRRMLRRPRTRDFRRRDRAFLRSGDELAALGARSLPPRLQLGRAFAGKARPRGDDLRVSARLFGDPPRARDGRGLCRHRRVLSRGGEIPSRRASRLQGAPLARGDARATAGAARCAGARSRSACCTVSRGSPTAAKPKPCRRRRRARSRASCRCPRSWASSLAPARAARGWRRVTTGSPRRSGRSSRSCNRPRSRRLRVRTPRCSPRELPACGVAR